MTRRTPAYLLKHPGFTFVGTQFRKGPGHNTAASRIISFKIYAALCDGELNTRSMKDNREVLRESIAGAVTRLLVLCVESRWIFGLLDTDTIFQSIIDKWKPNSELEPSPGATSRQEAAEGTTAVEAATEAAPATATATAVDSDPEPSWPPVYFAPEEKRLFSDARLISELQGVDNEHLQAPDVPTRKTEPLEIQEFLSLLALSYYRPTYRFALYPRPIAFNTCKDRHRRRGADFGTVGGLISSPYKKKSDDYAEGLQLIFFDPKDTEFDRFNDAVTSRLKEVFGSHIKEAFLGDIVSDEHWRPQLMYWNDITNLFDPTRASPLPPLAGGGNKLGGEERDGEEQGREEEHGEAEQGVEEDQEDEVQP
ncbi:hypothetical protein GGR53DRAFT_525091 [Hypoxylon sp. FL1150]|nr:hypothetical protein GGR53DRAFT_525091 [Hypoxylon sp. FL1150]